MSNVHKTLKTALAFVLLAVGTALLVLPGPGIPVIIAGVALLASEYTWAADLVERAKSTLRGLWRAVAT